MGKLNYLKIDLVVGFHVQDTGHQYLTQLIRFERLEVSF
jgi:glycerol-3-phosphate responsive antiterminator